jgi:DNA invertase Pin-like site-specific DNA recombinase
MSALARQPSQALEEKPQKLQGRHLERLAVVYIRQSSMAQVHHHQESTKLQYSLVDKARRLGWAPERILTIDEDLGLSGASAQGRQGFQRLLAEVALDHVGIVLGVEMSRLARSNRDWHQLLELCARFGTLIADLDGIYDPCLYNDRLLLGLKGTMSEAELHILRQRLQQGKLQKARRGELGKPVPTGYLRTASGDVGLDPDEEVCAVVHLIFNSFRRHGTVHGVLRELVQRGVRVGVRMRTAPDLGALEWRRPHRNMLVNILRNPIYAGAYVYGRRGTDPRKQQPGRPATGRTPLLPPEKWQVCLPGQLPAYIEWEEYQRNQARLDANRAGAEGSGPVREGSALLSGLVACGRCRYRMSVQYAKASNGKCYARYVCAHNSVTYGAAVCSSLSAPALDDTVARLALEALAPAALEVSLKVAREVEQERAERDALWQKRLERARYEAQRAERQYQAVEPENRLVARTLERQWEEKLQAARALEEEYHRQQQHLPRHLTTAERETIRQLAQDVPRLWAAKSTTVAEKKALLRLLMERVEVTVAKDTEQVDVVVHWAGGHQTRTCLERPVGRLRQLARHEQLLERIRALRRQGLTGQQIADTLNAEGWKTPTQRSPFNVRLVRAMVHRYGAPQRGPRPVPSDAPDAWWLADLARELKMPVVTLYGWIRRRWLKSRSVKGQRVAYADRKELARLRKLRQQQLRFRPATRTRGKEA